jgi:hypothetical protein
LKNSNLLLTRKKNTLGDVARGFLLETERFLGFIDPRDLVILGSRGVDPIQVSPGQTPLEQVELDVGETLQIITT